MEHRTAPHGEAADGLTVPTDELGEWPDDDDMIRNGLWNLEGPTGHPHAALGGDENWDYDEVKIAWLDHFAKRLAEHGITWDPTADGGPVALPAGMTVADAAKRWSAIYDGFDDWVIDVVDEARDGVGLAPSDGIRPDDAPGARWITYSIDT